MKETASSETLVTFKKGDHLFLQGDTSCDLYIIKRGSVKVYKQECGGDIELDRGGVGMVIGEVAAIDGGPRTASVVALEETEALIIGTSELKAVLAKIPDWFQKIALILVHRLRDVDEKIDLSVSHDKSAQVAALILLLTYSNLCNAHDNVWEFPLKSIENELMDILSLRPTDVTEFLEKLGKEGLCNIEKSKLIVKSREKLDSYTQAIFKDMNVAFAT